MSVATITASPAARAPAGTQTLIHGLRRGRSVCLCMWLVGKGMYFETHEEGGALTVNESFFLCHGAFRLFPCPGSS